jgi:two-component sensor histidine kinase
MKAFQGNRPNANMEVGAVRKFADGLEPHADSDAPSIVPQSIHGEHLWTISLSDQLLDEWDHRLKNNLQILVRLLESGFHEARSLEAREVLADAIRRVGAIGAGQRVYQYARGSTDVNAQDLVNTVCATARILFGGNVTIHSETVSETLPKEAAMPMALIINELLTNAAKYGGNQRGQVTITVSLRRQPGLYELRVQDEGNGFDLENLKSCLSGLGLVKALAQRLGGNFNVVRAPGARCTVRFPDRASGLAKGEARHIHDARRRQ